MANTPVFTLGLGVTVDKPVGAAFDSLHQWLERLRRQADSLRLGRIINEVIRLGGEQDKLQKTDQASYTQPHEHEAHIDRLRREGGEVERLRRLYQALALQSGEAAHSPPRAEKTTPAASPGTSDHPARSPVPIRVPGSRQTEPPSLGSRGSASTKGLAVATGVTAAVGAAYVGHRLVKRSSPIARTRARTAVSDQLEMGEAAFILKTMDALGSAQDGKEAAEGVGGAVGELGGTLLGAALGGLVGKGKGAEYGSLLGGFFGEKLGNWVGGAAHELFAGPTPEASVTEGADHTVVEERGKPLSGVGSAQDRARIGATQAGESPAVLGTPHEQPSNRRASIADGNPRTSVEGPGSPTHLAATRRDPTTVANGQASAEQAEGLGSVAGGLVGTLVGGAIGSVVPGFGTAVGSTVGGLLGEAVGGWIGRAWFAGDGESRTVSQQAGSNAVSASVQGVAMSPATMASAPGTSEPRGKGAAVNGWVKPAVVEAAKQGLQTFASDEPRNEKGDGYGHAAGGLVGTLLGGAVGSVVPLVGTTFGAALGGLVGGQLGGWLGKSWFDSTVKGEVAAEPSVSGQGAPDRKVTPGEVIRSIRREQPPSQNPGVPNPTAPAASAPVYNQQFTFTANMPVTVNNRLDDPLTLQYLEAIARRQLEELMRQARSVQLADTPHIAL